MFQKRKHLCELHSCHVYLKNGKFGVYLNCEKKNKGLLPGMSENDITPEIAIKLISLPESIGIFEGENIFELFDKISYSVRIDMGIPQAHLDENIDLPASETLTNSFEAFENYRATHPYTKGNGFGPIHSRSNRRNCDENGKIREK